MFILASYASIIKSILRLPLDNVCCFSTLIFMAINQYSIFDSINNVKTHHLNILCKQFVDTISLFYKK